MARLFRFEIPLPLVSAAFGTPAEADGTVRQYDFAVLIKRYRFPLGIIGLT